ncbi:4Fe-4S binding protein [Endozoicomonas sp. Mp262]|uniref:4Fe-4S dicluster domain-containing protein n=1 Tax=Endozoicomonas sp. Mp262 TaxID=2919499 RepID=UPI0021DA1F3B
MVETTEEPLVSPDRRAFFQRLTGGRESVIPVSQHPRPPWALENKQFLALCNNCDACVDQCPRRVLRKSEEQDEVLNGRPVLDLSYGSCDFCGQCVNACETGALNIEAGYRKQVIPKLAGTCQVEMGMYCDLCEDACPASAIKVTGNKWPVLKEDQCTGCGECALSCFSHVLVMTKLNS